MAVNVLLAWLPRRMKGTTLAERNTDVLECWQRRQVVRYGAWTVLDSTG